MTNRRSMQCWCGRKMDGQLCAGCGSYFIDCDCSETQAVRDHSQLTDRQRLILMVYAYTGDYAETARQLGISRSTISNTLVAIRRKLHVDTTMQALLALIGQQEQAA